MSDFLHKDADDWRNEAWKIIHECSNLDWLVLTKRPERIAEHLPADWGYGYPNVWLGVTVESQAYVDRISHIGKLPAAVRFVSAEPLLGPIDFSDHIQCIDWVITGCEQAGKNKRRPMEDDWVRGIRNQCDAASVALFHKQHYSGTTLMHDGKIDGETRQAFPIAG